MLNNLPDYINKQNIEYDEGRPYLDTRYFDNPSELFKVDVSSTGRKLDGIMNNYNALGRKMNLYHSQIVVYQDVLKDLSIKMQPGSFGTQDYGSDIKSYYDLVGIYGEISDTTTTIPHANEYGGGTLTTRLLWADFNGRGFSHEALMKCYEQLCDNEQDYSNKVAEKEHEYFVLKQNVTHLANNRGLNSYADPSVRAGVKSSYVRSSASLMSETTLLTEVVSEPDPYDDLVAPMIKKIETARTNLGQVSNPEFVSNILFTVDCKLSGESVDSLKDYITVNSEFVNIDSAEAYYYDELLTGKFELGDAFAPKIYYSFKEGAIVEENVEVSIAGVDKYYIKYGEDDKGTYVTVEGILFSVEQSEGDIATENHDYSIKDVTKATLTSNGKIVTKCKDCGKVSDTKTIYYPKTVTLSATSYTYDGKVKTPAVTVKDSDGKVISSGNYSVAYASGRTNVGTYKVTVTFKNNYSGSKALSFKINAVSSAKCSVKLGATSYTYDGKVKTPTVTVKNATGKVLKKNTDYTLTYAAGRKNVGKYTVKITFKGNYSGTKTLYFTIKPKGTSISKVTAGSKKFTVKWKKQATQTTGYQIQYSTSSKFTNAKTVTVSNNKTTGKTISFFKAKKRYFARVRTYKTVKINGKSTNIYSSWSKAKYVTTKK